MNKIAMIVILVGSLAILIGCLVDVGLTVYRANEMEKNTKFPPWPGKCPDYWENMGDNICKNTHKIGLCKSGRTDNEMNFNEPIFKNNRGMYYKCNWSKQCNAPWEGIDNLC